MAPAAFKAGSTNADWLRALERTAAITPMAARTLADIVEEHARKTPDRPALIGTSTLTYANLGARSRRYGQWALAQNLRPGDRVALLLAACPDYAALWIGLTRVGVVVALLNTQLVEAGLAHCLALADAHHVIVGASHLRALEAAVPPGPLRIWVHGAADAASHPRLDSLIDAWPEDVSVMPPSPVRLRDTALLIYTSGTTGLPKAARVSHYRIVTWSEWFAGMMNAQSDDRLYNCLPMHHSIGGVVAVGAMLAAGGAVVVRDGFSASRFWPDVVESGATIFQYIGELCRYLLNAPPQQAEHRHRLRLCCGNGLRADIWHRFAARFRIPKIIEFYAATEGSFSLFNLEGKPGAIGRIPRFMAHLAPVALVKFDVASERPVRGDDGFCVRCDIDEVGEAIGRLDRQVTDHAGGFEGYTNPAESERKILRDVFAPGDMWFRTGDLMSRDAQGFFYFADRIGDTFRWKGENVATSEIAGVLCACAGVRDANVYGVEVPSQDGRAGMAALAIDPSFELATLHRHVAASLPRFARPVFLRQCTDLALTATFKLKKADLVRDGFDPRKSTDPLWFDDGAAYRSLDAALHARIVSGAVRI